MQLMRDVVECAHSAHEMPDTSKQAFGSCKPAGCWRPNGGMLDRVRNVLTDTTRRDAG